MRMPGRMEAVQKRLEALLVAIKIVRPALVTFYRFLNDEQKARCNLMAPPKPAMHARHGSHGRIDQSGGPSCERIASLLAPRLSN